MRHNLYEITLPSIICQNDTDCSYQVDQCEHFDEVIVDYSVDEEIEKHLNYNLSKFDTLLYYQIPYCQRLIYDWKSWIKQNITALSKQTISNLKT